jgi:S1-C subfamily serine protease
MTNGGHTPSTHGLPDAASRTWLHPSELPSFRLLPTYEPAVQRIRHLIVVGVALVALMATSVVANSLHPLVANGAMPDHVVSNERALPVLAFSAAQQTVALTVVDRGQERHLAAMVLPRGLIVTTTPIAARAHVTVAVGSRTRNARLVGTDPILGFSVLRYNGRVAVAPYGRLSAHATVTAVAPIVNASTGRVSYEWANTQLGPRTVDARGSIRYVAIKSDASLRGVTDALAMNASGQVVAILSSNAHWYAASFVARIATVLATGNGCHTGLGVLGMTASRGGVMLTTVLPRHPGWRTLDAGDVITGFNGARVANWDDLVTAIYQTPAHQRVTLSVVEAGRVRQVDVTLACAL